MNPHIENIVLLKSLHVSIVLRIVMCSGYEGHRVVVMELEADSDTLIEQRDYVSFVKYVCSVLSY